MVQQTAVEWLMQNIEKTLPNFIEAWRVEYEQAKQMEKEQHQETFKHSRQAKIFEDNKPPVWKSFEQYYNETYKP